MGIFAGSSEVDALFAGSSEVDALYLGGDLVWPSTVDWNTYVASLSPYAWWKLDEENNPPGTQQATDASGNGRHGVYNGTSTFPTRRVTALVPGSSFAIRTANGFNVNQTGIGAALDSGSFTFGAWLQTTTTTGGNAFVTAPGLIRVGLNYNWVTGANQSGTISWLFDIAGANANALAATGSGWNDGNPHLVLFERDNTADTISIWIDGVRVATRAHVGANPALAGGTWIGGPANVDVDEYLFFDRILTGTEHTNLASYA